MISSLSIEGLGWDRGLVIKDINKLRILKMDVKFCTKLYACHSYGPLVSMPNHFHNDYAVTISLRESVILITL